MSKIHEGGRWVFKMLESFQDLIIAFFAFVSLFAGLILKEVANLKYEQRYLRYLAYHR